MLRNPDDNPSLADILDTDVQTINGNFASADWYTIPQRKNRRDRWVVLKDRTWTPNQLETIGPTAQPDKKILDMSVSTRFPQTYPNGTALGSNLIQNSLRIYIVSSINSGGVTSYINVACGGKLFFSDDTR